MAPDRVVVPEPNLVSAAVPLTIPEAVKLPVPPQLTSLPSAMAPLAVPADALLLVSTPTKPLAPPLPYPYKVRALLVVWPLRSKDTVLLLSLPTTAAAVPNAVLEPSFRVPALTVVPPV